MDKTTAKIVSPLKKLLMDLPMEEYLLFLHRIRVSYSISRQKDGVYHAIVYGDGMVKYMYQSPNSAKSALCDCIAGFLIGEKKDYHSYLGKS